MRELLEDLRDTLEDLELDERFEPAKVGTVRKWQKGEFKKTSKGWERITKGSGPTRAGEKPALKKKGAAAAPAPKKAAKAAGGPLPKGSAAAAPAGKKGAAKGKPAPQDGGTKKSAKVPTKKPKTAGPPPEKTPEQQKVVQDTTTKLKKHDSIFPTFRKGWNKMRKAWTTPGMKERVTTGFMDAMEKEAGETGRMLKTMGKAFIPGVKLDPKEVENAQHQFVDIAKTILVASLATSPLGIVAIGLTAVGIRVDKVINAFIDRPLRAATARAFGKEHGLLPSAFYETDKPKRKKSEEPGLTAPKPKKPKVEWVDAEGTDLEDEEDDLDIDEIRAGAEEQAQQTLAQIMDRVLDLMSEMDPHDEDFAEALVDAGLTPEEIDDFIKYAEMAKMPQYNPQDTADQRNDSDAGADEEVSDFRRLAGLVESKV